MYNLIVLNEKGDFCKPFMQIVTREKSFESVITYLKLLVVLNLQQLYPYFSVAHNIT